MPPTRGKPEGDCIIPLPCAWQLVAYKQTPRTFLFPLPFPLSSPLLSCTSLLFGRPFFSFSLSVSTNSYQQTNTWTHYIIRFLLIPTFVLYLFFFKCFLTFRVVWGGWCQHWHRWKSCDSKLTRPRGRKSSYVSSDARKMGTFLDLKCSRTTVQELHCFWMGSWSVSIF